MEATISESGGCCAAAPSWKKTAAIAVTVGRIEVLF
jgi:hypothetical protein